MYPIRSFTHHLHTLQIFRSIAINWSSMESAVVAFFVSLALTEHWALTWVPNVYTHTHTYAHTPKWITTETTSQCSPYAFLRCCGQHRHNHGSGDGGGNKFRCIRSTLSNVFSRRSRELCSRTKEEGKKRLTLQQHNSPMRRNNNTQRMNEIPDARTHTRSTTLWAWALMVYFASLCCARSVCLSSILFSINFFFSLLFVTLRCKCIKFQFLLMPPQHTYLCSENRVWVSECICLCVRVCVLMVGERVYLVSERVQTEKKSQPQRFQRWVWDNWISIHEMVHTKSLIHVARPLASRNFIKIRFSLWCTCAVHNVMHVNPLDFTLQQYGLSIWVRVCVCMCMRVCGDQLREIFLALKSRARPEYRVCVIFPFLYLFFCFLLLYCSLFTMYAPSAQVCKIDSGQE